jgi:hypothetical protein
MLALKALLVPRVTLVLLGRLALRVKPGPLDRRVPKALKAIPEPLALRALKVQLDQ